MSRATFPTLLHKTPKILGPLTRFDLTGVGLSYFTLSALKISGIVQLLLMAVGLFVFKYINSKLPCGFFRLITSPRQLKWSYKLERKS